MEWQPIDFYGIISLDHHVADLLKQHLEEKEAHLADEILKLTSSDNFSDADQPPKASFAFESLTAYLKSNGHLEPDQKNLLINQLNEGFWDYTEVLKSCAVELFQQINQLDVDQWHSSMLDVVKQIKSLLQKHIEEFTWSLRRLESPLQTFMKPKNTGLLRKLWKNNFSSENLDFEIISHLAQSERFLQQQYNEFYERFQEYTHVKNEAELSQKKMHDYAIISLLDENESRQFLDLYRLLRMWELTPESSRYLKLSIAQHLRSLSSQRIVLQIYKHHFDNLKQALFRGSREIKEETTSDKTPEDLTALTHTIEDRTLWFQEELKAFIVMLMNHREFLLATDPNPYIKTRLGFTERPVGTEPERVKDLNKLIIQSEQLNKWYDQFNSALRNPPHEDVEQAHDKVSRLLHEMSQPLISKAFFKQISIKLLDTLSTFQELGSNDPKIVDLIEESLNLAMRADWKHHLLHENPEFHEIFRIHSEITQDKEDKAHYSRMMHFKQLCAQIENWIEKGNIDLHWHDIELDMNDMKIYLQNFFVHVQKLIKEPIPPTILYPLLSRLQHQLLDYRYLFGQFFCNLSKKEEGMVLRNRFLFVDQYFESIENIWTETLRAKKHVRDK